MNVLILHGIIIFLVVFLLHFVHRSWDYTILLVIANAFTDVLKLLVFGLIDRYAGGLGNILTMVWISAGIIIIVLGFYTYFTQVVKKKRISEHADLLILLLVSFILHAVLDLVFIDRLRF